MEKKQGIHPELAQRRTVPASSGHSNGLWEAMHKIRAAGEDEGSAERVLQVFPTESEEFRPGIGDRDCGAG